MVFSNECNESELQGKAIVVPFENNPINLAGIELESQELIKSERKRNVLDSDRFNWGWGTLTISVNPNILRETSEKYNQANLLLDFWRSKYSRGFKPDNYKVGQEQPILNSQGILNFNWTDELNEFDFIVATATKPDREYYPTSKNIADRILVNEYDEYFNRNREFGICTFQDNEIVKILTNK